MNYDWTEARVDLAKKLFNDGLSASQIAGELPGIVSRNAAIGKLNRLGYTRAAKGGGQKRPSRLTRMYDSWAKPERRTPFREPVVEAAAIPFVEVIPAPPANPVTLMELEPHHCRWPIGDPTSPDFRFCGNQADGSYCRHHHAIAYAPQSRRPLTPADRRERARLERLSRSRRAFA